MKLRVATRKSRLALVQTRWVITQLRKFEPELEVEEVQVVTEGDRVLDRPLAEVGGKGLFVSEVEAYLSRAEADFAIHSLKDIPGDTPLAEGLEIVATPKREDPRDVLLCNEALTLDDLPRGARIGTSSLRRTVQLRAQRPDLEFATLRGNVDTRIKKLQAGGFQAIVLAAAGLARLELLDSLPHTPLPTSSFLPALGQGTLAIEAPRAHEDLVTLLHKLEDPTTRIATEAERSLLESLHGNCHTPIAGYAYLSNDGVSLSLDAMVASHDGTRILSASGDRIIQTQTQSERIKAAQTLGHDIAEQLLSQGAKTLIEQAEIAAIQRTKSN